MRKTHVSQKSPTIFNIKSFAYSIWPFKSAANLKDQTVGVKNGGGQISSSKGQILTNFLSFEKKTVEDVMIPRSDICAVKSSITLEGLNGVIMEHSHTRTLVYEDNLDNIIGFIHIKDLFKVIASKQHFELKKILRKPIIAPQSKRIVDLLSEMQKKRTHIAVVVDEYGGTDGIVTIEDVIEEIVGQIDDEHDKKAHNNSYQIVNPQVIIASARVEVKELEKVLGVSLSSEDDEFDTIGGLILAKVGSVPSPGTVISISDGVEVEVIEASPRNLKQVKLTLRV